MKEAKTRDKFVRLIIKTEVYDDADDLLNNIIKAFKK